MYSYLCCRDSFNIFLAQMELLSSLSRKLWVAIYLCITLY